MTGWLVEDARPDSWPVLAEIYVAATRAVAIGPPIDDPAAVARFALDRIGRMDRCWTANLAGVPLGFLGLAGDTIHLLYVAPAAWGLGAGTALVRAAQAANGALRLDCLEESARARRFYTARGFRQQAAPVRADGGHGPSVVRYAWQGD